MFRGSPTEKDLLEMAEKQEQDYQEHEMICSGCYYYRELTGRNYGKCLAKRWPSDWVFENNKMCHFKPKIKKKAKENGQDLKTNSA